MSEMGHIRLESNSDMLNPYGTNDSRNSQQKSVIENIVAVMIVT